MKLLHFADLHLDTQFRWAGALVAAKRRQALRDTLDRILNVATEVAADAILCGGDLYEQERFTPDTVEFLRAAFERVYPLPVYVAPGNHDWLGSESPYRFARWSPNVHVFTSNRLQPVTLAEGLTLWGAAHNAPANTDGFLENFRVDRSGVNLALFHGSERGSLFVQGEGKAPHAPFHAGQIPRAGLAHAFLGHYHCPQDAERYTYPGNPDPLSFGETGERGVVIATVAPDGSVSRERRRVAVSEVHDIDVDVTGCASNQEVRERIGTRLAGLGGVARVTLCGELSADVELHLEDLAGVAPDLDTPPVARVGAIHSAYDLDALAQEQTVRGQFVRDVRASDLPDDKKRRVLITGLRALGGRGDLEVP